MYINKMKLQQYIYIYSLVEMITKKHITKDINHHIWSKYITL